MTKLESIKKHGESAQGRKELLSYLKGKPLTVNQAVLARCYDCMSYYADGVGDCKAPDCPLYEYMPYRTLSRKSSRTAKKKAAKKAMRKKSSNGKEKNSRAKKAAPPVRERLPVKAEKTSKEKASKIPVKADKSSKTKPSKKKDPQPLHLF